MHIDENKKFDKRNIGRNIRNGAVTEKDYEIYLSKLPDVSEKVFSPEEVPPESGVDSGKEIETPSKKKGIKKKGKGKGR